MIVRRLRLAGVGLLVACGGGSAGRPAERPPAFQAPAATSLLRLPAAGGSVRAYRAADLRAHEWRSERAPRLRDAVGTDLEQQLLYAIDSTRTLTAVDLRTRRVRPLRRGVRAAGLGPDGTLYSVDSAGIVTVSGRRRTLALSDRVRGTTAGLVGTLNGRLLVLPEARRADVLVLSASDGLVRREVPAGPSDATAYGDLVAVAADSAVYLVEPGEDRPAREVSLSGHARAVAFSPSGHRFYVARDDDELHVYDRWSADRLQSIDLPGPARAVRSDLYGAWLLVRPAVGDSIWIVDVALGRHVATVRSQWGTDLPAVAPPGTLVVRRGADVVGLDLDDPALTEVGRVEGGAADRWLPVVWRPAGEEPAPAARPDSTALAGADTSAAAAERGARFYLQVSSSRNPAWAREFAERMTQTGLEATVLDPAPGEDAYRVVLGPYSTREAAETASRSLSMASFILTVPDGSPR